MCTQLKTACNACPWRTDSMKGWLGASTPVEFLQQSEAETQMPCHLHVDYESKTWQRDALKAPQCAGRAIHFANRAKRPQDSNLLVLPANRDEVFSNPQDFIDHHTVGGPAPKVMIIGPRVQVMQ